MNTTDSATTASDSLPETTDEITENIQEQATESTPESEADATNLTAEAPKANVAAVSELGASSYTFDRNTKVLTI